MADTAAHLVDSVLPRAPYRQSRDSSHPAGASPRIPWVYVLAMRGLAPDAVGFRGRDSHELADRREWWLAGLERLGQLRQLAERERDPHAVVPPDHAPHRAPV